MLYRIVRPFASLALKTNFRRIYFSNAQVVPKNKPIILAVNHPSAFLEPCLLACLLPQPLHYLVRGDMFVSTFARKALEALHMIPIYRIRDGGFGKVRQNFSTFESCFNILSENKTIMILAEGTTIQEKRLRPIQKGPARIAFGALEKDDLIDLKIVPVGVNYTYADKFRSHVMFEFGQPISIQDYKEVYKEHSNRAIQLLTKEIENRLKKHVIIINEKEDEELTEKLFVLSRNNQGEPFFPIVSRHNTMLCQEKKIATFINNASEKEKKELKEKVDAYLKILNQNNLKDWAIAQNDTAEKPSSLMVLIGFLPFVLGYFGNYLPVFIAKLIANKFVIYLEFMASVKIAVAIGVFIIYYIGLIIFSIAINNFMLLLMILMLPFFGYYSLMYNEYYERWKAFREIDKIDLTFLQKLKANREDVLNFINEN